MPHRVLAVLTFLLFLTSAHAVQDFTVTREELTMMPPYCTALYGKNVGLPQAQILPLRNTVPPDCPALQHYCDGLKAMIRIDRYRTERGHWIHDAVAAFESVVTDWEHRGTTCPLRSEAYTNLGNALLRQNKASAGVAVIDFNKALELRKDYLPVYYALSDAYLYLGKKKEALGVVEEGLKYEPDSKGLLRRFKELGGKTLPIPIAKTAPQLPPQPDKAVGAQQAEPGAAVKEKQVPATSQSPQPSAAAGPEPSISPITTPNKAAGESPVAAPAAAQPEPPKIGSPNNPYCRFCPD